MLTLTVKEWTKIRKQLKEEYSWKPSIFLIREVMKRELGFTVREHVGYRPKTQKELELYDISDVEWHDTEKDRKFYRENIRDHIICLDFYNDEAESFFVLKYL
jgi:hypothetical protein